MSSQEEALSSDSESSKESLAQISKFTRIAELEKELRMLKEKSSNTQIEQQITSKGTKGIPVQHLEAKLKKNAATSSKKTNKNKNTAKKPIKYKEEEWSSSDPEQVIYWLYQLI